MACHSCCQLYKYEAIVNPVDRWSMHVSYSVLCEASPVQVLYIVCTALVCCTYLMFLPCTCLSSWHLLAHSFTFLPLIPLCVLLSPLTFSSYFSLVRYPITLLPLICLLTPLLSNPSLPQSLTSYPITLLSLPPSPSHPHPPTLTSHPHPPSPSHPHPPILTLSL